MPAVSLSSLPPHVPARVAKALEDRLQGVAPLQVYAGEIARESNSSPDVVLELLLELEEREFCQVGREVWYLDDEGQATAIEVRQYANGFKPVPFFSEELDMDVTDSSRLRYAVFALFDDSIEFHA